MPGPSPNPQARRRNAPTVAAQTLPAEGRRGRAPAVPKPYALAKAGRAWWSWAWRLPQATRWDAGAVYLVARRAQLEDQLAALDFVDYTELRDLLAGADREAMKQVEWALSSLKRLASGATSVMKEMRELDDRLGLNPKAMMALRWTIAESAPTATLSERGEVARMDDYRSRVG